MPFSDITDTARWIALYRAQESVRTAVVDEMILDAVRVHRVDREPGAGRDRRTPGVFFA
jgi:hypothetical protein